MRLAGAMAGPAACCLLAAGACLPAQAQVTRENLAPIEGRGLATLVGGLVLDSTVTVLGYEFFSAFAVAWRELDAQQRYSVTISETPTARFGSTIRVHSRGKTLWQNLVRPNRLAARETAQAVAGDLFQNMIRAEAEEALFRDPDLGPEELQ
ncbi:MAG TPA: CsgE family curli-type amyloid fiber assembly protein [Ramlibacter sp.]|nr:CsgE family curli-type amyloid fiber assembly protein [Ramlibacter sp.]